MRQLPLAAAVISVTITCLVGAGPASAAGVTLTGTPDAIHLSTGEAATVLVVVSNDGGTPATGLQVSAPVVDGGGVTATVRPPKRTSLKPGAATKVNVAINVTEVLPATRSITVLARYRLGGVAKIATTVIKVEPATPFDPSKVASLTVHASLDTVLSGSTQDIIVVVANASGGPLAVGPLALELPTFLEVSADCGKDDPRTRRKVGAYSSVSIPVSVDVTERVRPGKHQIVVTAPVAVVPQGQRFSLTAVKEASVSVKGESAIATAFGGSALILLPGALFLGLITMLWKLRFLRHRSDANADLEIDVKSAPFVALTVGASFGIVWLWSMLPFGTDLFEYYGLADILYVLVFAAVLGTVLYCLPMGYRYWQAAKRTPKTGDDELTVLRKLHRQGLGPYRPTIGQGAAQAFLLERQDLDRKRAWACPAIKLTWKDSPPAGTTQPTWAKQLEDTHKLISVALDEHRDAGELADLLRDGQSEGTLTVRFEKGGSHDEPYLASEDDLKQPQGPTQAIIREA